MYRASARRSMLRDQLITLGIVVTALLVMVS